MGPWCLSPLSAVAVAWAMAWLLGTVARYVRIHLCGDGCLLHRHQPLVQCPRQTSKMDPQRKSYLIEAACEAQPYPPERALAYDWLTAKIDLYDDIDWQKRVGPGVTLGAEYSPGVQAMAYQATRKRVDLVAYRNNTTTIIELKDRVDLAAVRQALEYADLWKFAPTNPPVAAVVVVGNTGDADIVNTAAAQGVTVELLGPTRSPNTPA